MVTGTCLCAAVAFEISERTTAIELCHCNRCKKAFGTAFAATLYAGREAFRWLRGEELVVHYDAPLRQGPPAYRHSFCRTCGSPLPIVREGLPVVEIPAGLIDGDPGCRPQYHQFTKQKALWFEITDRLPQHAAGVAADQRVRLG